MNTPFKFTLVLLLCATAPIQAATVIYVQSEDNQFVTDYQGVKNTTTASNVSDRNFGGAAVLTIGRNNQRHALIHFDLSSMQGQVDSLLSATITFTLVGAATAGNMNITMYEMFSTNAGWLQGTGDGLANGPNGTATHSEFAENSTAWKNGSGTNQTSVIGTYSLAAPLQTLLYTPTDTSLTFTIPTAIIQAWILDPSAHAGIIFAPSTPAGGSTANNYIANFGMSSNATASLRPSLTIEYLAIPEPASTWLLLCGGALIWARTRRRN